MVILGERIRSLDKHLVAAKKLNRVVIGLTDLERFAKLLKKVGFSSALVSGETVLPPPTFGPVSSYNAEGKFLIHRDRRKETCYRQVEWHWTEWHGRDDRVERSKIVDVPYKRYPRTFVPPPGIEFTIANSQSGDKILVTPPIRYDTANAEAILHTVNLFLEVFNECSVLTDKLQHILKAQVKRLNWQILPKGKMPWSQLHSRLQPIIAKAPKGNQAVIRYRLESINSHEPAFVAVGRAGFKGYIVFGFPEDRTFLLESIYHGNATYVFGNDWERLSKLTKAEVLNQNLQMDRIVHRDGWYRKIARLLR